MAVGEGRNIYDSNSGFLAMGKKAKTELRVQLRRILANLDPRWHSAASREVCKNLNLLLEEIEAGGIEITHVLAWCPFFPGEIDLTEFITFQSEKRKVYLPVMREDGMQFYSVLSGWRGELVEGDFGIPQPQSGKGELFDVAAAAQTVVVVPGIAFDRKGNRLGRGKGYYDRFLGRSKLIGLTKIGVTFALQIFDSVPVENHDVSMDFIVTEEEQIKI